MKDIGNGDQEFCTHTEKSNQNPIPLKMGKLEISSETQRHLQSQVFRALKNRTSLQYQMKLRESKYFQRLNLEIKKN